MGEGSALSTPPSETTLLESSEVSDGVADTPRALLTEAAAARGSLTSEEVREGSVLGTTGDTPPVQAPPARERRHEPSPPRDCRVAPRSGPTVA